MKKVLIAVIGIALAMGAQAAFVDWSYKVTGATEGAYASGYTAYLFEKATWTAAVTDGITATTFNSALDSSALTYLSKGMGTSNYRYATSDAANNIGADRAISKDAWVSGTAYDFYVVVVNGNVDPAQYIATATSITARGEQDSNNGTGAFSTTSASLTSWTPVSTSGGDVPEPTSGLLLLVGGAMLALRRKQK